MYTGVQSCWFGTGLDLTRVVCVQDAKGKLDDKPSSWRNLKASSRLEPLQEVVLDKVSDKPVAPAARWYQWRPWKQDGESKPKVRVHSARCS